MCPTQLGSILRKRSNREGLRNCALSPPDLFRSRRLGPNGGIGKRDRWPTRPRGGQHRIGCTLPLFLSRVSGSNQSNLGRRFFQQTTRSPLLQSTKSSVIGACSEIKEYRRIAIA